MRYSRIDEQSNSAQRWHAGKRNINSHGRRMWMCRSSVKFISHCRNDTLKSDDTRATCRGKRRILMWNVRYLLHNFEWLKMFLFSVSFVLVTSQLCERIVQIILDISQTEYFVHRFHFTWTILPSNIRNKTKHYLRGNSRESQAKENAKSAGEWEKVRLAFVTSNFTFSCLHLSPRHLCVRQFLHTVAEAVFWFSEFQFQFLFAVIGCRAVCTGVRCTTIWWINIAIVTWSCAVWSLSHTIFYVFRWVAIQHFTGCKLFAFYFSILKRGRFATWSVYKWSTCTQTRSQWIRTGPRCVLFTRHCGWRNFNGANKTQTAKNKSVWMVEWCARFSLYMRYRH